MQASNVGYRNRVIAVYLLTTNLKGVSSMKLHCDLKIAQKVAWLLMHKIRNTFEDSLMDAFGTWGGKWVKTSVSSPKNPDSWGRKNFTQSKSRIKSAT